MDDELKLIYSDCTNESNIRGKLKLIREITAHYYSTIVCDLTYDNYEKELEIVRLLYVCSHLLLNSLNVNRSNLKVEYLEQQFNNTTNQRFGNCPLNFLKEILTDFRKATKGHYHNYSSLDITQERLNEEIYTLKMHGEIIINLITILKNQ